jgi:hypothetical protein
LYEELIDDGYGDNIKLIGVGKDSHMSALSNWTGDNDASVTADEASYPVWNEWGASQRDLYILSHQGELIFHENVTGGLPSDLESMIIDLIPQPTCDEGFIEILDVPNTCVVFDQSSCFYEGDLQVISDIAETNGIFNLNPLHMGSQNWLEGRLKRIQVGNYSQGGNIQLTSLPESISGLESITTLQIDKNALTELPEGIGELAQLQLLIASNNDISSIPESINNLNQVWYLDLGYNALETLPDISNMTSLSYLYIFGNQLSSIPESICNLDLDWSGVDNSFMPYFACGGNNLCENIPECVQNSENFEIGLEANYYSFTIELLQDCSDGCVSGDINSDGSIDVLDVVNTVGFILGSSAPTEDQGCAADINSDGNIDVLDVVQIVQIILN